MVDDLGTGRTDMHQRMRRWHCAPSTSARKRNGSLPILCIYCIVLGTACDRGDKTTASPNPSASAVTSAAVPAPPSAAPAASSARSVPTDAPKLAEPVGPERTYRTIRFGDGNAFKPLKDDCDKPYVKLADSPNTQWNWIRQVMLANPEFREVRDPSEPMQVTFLERETPEAFEIYARCADAKTCNELAGMYLQTVWASFPRPRCGELPEELVSVHLTADDGLDIAPEPTKHLPLCARLNACATRIDPKNTKVGPECQKAWTKFPLECARKATCADVMACMEESGR